MFSVNDAGSTGYPYGKYDTLPFPLHKTQRLLRGIKIISVQGQTIKLLEKLKKKKIFLTLK